MLCVSSPPQRYIVHECPSCARCSCSRTLMSLAECMMSLSTGGRAVVQSAADINRAALDVREIPPAGPSDRELCITGYPEVCCNGYGYPCDGVHSNPGGIGLGDCPPPIYD